MHLLKKIHLEHSLKIVLGFGIKIIVLTLTRVHMITIITKWYCPYCHAAVRILKKLEVEYKNIDITFQPKLYKQVQEITNFHTVPQVFILIR